MRRCDFVSVLGVLVAAGLAVSGCQCGAVLHGARHGTLWISSQESGNLMVLDAADGGFIGRVSLPGGGGRGASVAASPDGTRVYAADEASGVVNVIDVRGLQVASSITGLARPRDLRPSPDGRKLYVAQASSNQIAVIDLQTSAVERVAAGGTATTSRTQSLWVTPSGDLYVLNQLSSTLVRMDLSAGAPSWSLDVATNPTRLVVARAGDMGYLTGALDGVVQKVRVSGSDAPILGPVAPVGASPHWLSLSENERWLVVSNGGVEDTISLLDLNGGFVERGKVVVGVGDVGQNALSPDSSTAFVCVGIPPRLAVVNLEQGAVVATYSLPEVPRGLAYLPPQPAGPR